MKVEKSFDKIYIAKTLADAISDCSQLIEDDAIRLQFLKTLKEVIESRLWVP